MQCALCASAIVRRPIAHLCQQCAATNRMCPTCGRQGLFAPDLSFPLTTAHLPLTVTAPHSAAALSDAGAGAFALVRLLPPSTDTTTSSADRADQNHGHQMQILSVIPSTPADSPRSPPSSTRRSSRPVQPSFGGGPATVSPLTPCRICRPSSPPNRRTHRMSPPSPQVSPLLIQ